MKYPVTFMVVAEPSMFRRHETEVRYFATLKRARKWSKRYVRKNPCGEAVTYTRKRGSGRFLVDSSEKHETKTIGYRLRS